MNSISKPKPQTTTFMVALVSFITSALCIPLVPVICGHIARARMKTSSAPPGGAFLAITGLILGYLMLLVIATCMVVAAGVKMGFWKETVEKTSCVCQRAHGNWLLDEHFLDQMHLKPGEPIRSNSFVFVWIQKECPSGGAYIISTTVPEDGEPWITCPNAEKLEH